MTRAAVKPPVQRSPDPAPATRVRCRQIADADLDALAGLLAEGFAHTGMDYWRRGFARAALLPPVEGMPRFGYALESEKGLVGALLAGGLVNCARGCGTAPTALGKELTWNASA